MPDICHLIRHEIAQIEPYTPVVPPHVLAQRLGTDVQRIIKLDANENPYGPAPAVANALADIAPYAQYPDPDQTRLRAALSNYTGQPAGRIICGAGADELIDLLLRLVLRPGDQIIDFPPTFGMYAFDAAVCDGHVITIPRRDDFSLDTDTAGWASMSSRVRALFVASPNNPDGSIAPLKQIDSLCRCPLIVAVDEAYIEFTANRHGVSHLLEHYPNLVILRTFSKWAGLAGLRLGYALLSEELAEHLWKIKQPYNINVAAEAAALASLNALDYLHANIARIVSERERLSTALRAIEWLHVYPSEANFVLCRVLRGSARTLRNALLRDGIAVRHYEQAGLRDCVRISVGLPEHNDMVIQALHRIELEEEQTADL